MALNAILHHAQVEPDRLALVYEGHEIGYGALAGFIVATGRFLAAQGLPGSGVAVVCARPLLDALVLGYALRALGLTTVIIRDEAEAPSLATLDIACLVTLAAHERPGLSAFAGKAGWRQVRMPRDLGGGERAFVPSASPGGHILLTSGATGRPKMVLASPATDAIYHPLRRRTWGITAGSVVNLLDFGGWTAVGHNGPASVWGVGGAVVIASGDERRASMLRPDLTHAVMTPLFLSHLAAHPPQGLHPNPALTLISTGGALTPAAIAQVRARISPRLFDGLSTTEAGLFAYTPLDTPEDYVWKRIIPGREVRVADDAGAAVPVGQVGRLGVRIIDGTHGYLGDPEGSREIFQDGFFYSGDLAILGPDGRIALQGRASDVLNIGGAKRPAGPIEAAIQAALGARSVCLLQAPDGGGDLRLHVVVEADRIEATVDLAAVLTEPLRELDSVQVHCLEALPRNHMGKVDRAALRVRLGLDA